MVVELINEYRALNNKERIFSWDPVQNDYCLAHCLYLAREDNLDHAPAYLLKDKAEAIARCDYGFDEKQTARHLIFDVLNSSEEHRKVLLEYDNLAYGFYIYNYKAYLVIRGWR